MSAQIKVLYDALALAPAIESAPGLMERARLEHGGTLCLLFPRRAGEEPISAIMFWALANVGGFQEAIMTNEDATQFWAIWERVNERYRAQVGSGPVYKILQDSVIGL